MLVMDSTGGTDDDFVPVAVKDGMWPEYADPTYRMPQEIDYTAEEGNALLMGVAKFSGDKQYLGGFRHKATGAVYHHAETQTPNERGNKVRDYNHLRTRETQTYDTRTVSIQQNRECGTQMERVDLALDGKRDVTKQAHKYLTADQLLDIKIEKVIEIQRIWRGHMAKNRAEGIRRRDEEYVLSREEKREEVEAIAREERLKELQEKMHPRSQEEFSRLFNELDQWRRTEAARIKESVPAGEERKRALAELLVRETKALQDIQKLRNLANREHAADRTRHLLELMAQPQKWQLSSGGELEVETPQTIRAAALLSLYEELCAPVSSVPRRLDLLARVRAVVEPHQSPLVSDIAELLEREADLLDRSRSVHSMDRLRLRTSNLFLQFVQDPRYNQRATEFVNY